MKKQGKWTVEFELEPPVLIDNVSMFSIPNVMGNRVEISFVDDDVNSENLKRLYEWLEKTFGNYGISGYYAKTIDYKANVTFVHDSEPGFTLINAWPSGVNWNSLDMTSDVTTLEISLVYDKLW